MNKRYLKYILPLCLVLLFGVCFTIGDTLAFLQEKSETLINRFKAGIVQYTLNLEENKEDSNIDMPNMLDSIYSTELAVSFIPDKAPGLSGYVFSGWYYDDACMSEYTDISGNEITVKYGDSHDRNSDANKVEVTLYAKWNPATYSIIYDGNGATQGSMESSIHIYDLQGQLSQNEYIRPGYEFLGWSTEKNATSAMYADEQSVMNLTDENGAELKVYAVWRQMDFMLSFDTQVDSILAPTSRKVTYQQPYGSLPTIARVGYAFAGWTLSKNSADYIASDTIVDIPADHTVYAQWKARAYTIRFHANGGEGAMDDIIVSYDSMITLPPIAYTKNDYKFGGWAKTPDGKVEFNDKQEVVNLQEEGVVDLYATWIQNSHTVTFDYNLGSGEPPMKEVLYGQEYGVLPTYPTLTEKLFTGWYTQKEGGTRILPETIVDRMDDHTLYAHWEPSPANDIIKDLVVRNNPDDNGDGVADAIYLTFRCSSSFEKFNIPLNNLVPGQKYRLTYTASNNASFGDNKDGYGGSVYGSYIVKNVTETGGLINDAVAKDIIGTWENRGKGDAAADAWLNGPFKSRTITFTANASTMYWTWDFGLMEDGPMYEYNISDIVLEPVVPTIEFGSKDLIIYQSSKAQVINDHSSAYESNFVFDGDGYAETMCYPIKGLTSGTTYMITFDHKFDGALIDDTKTYTDIPRYHYGCGIMATKPTMYGSFMDSIGKYISNTFVMSSVTGDTESVTLTFTASGSEVYWVWNMANCSDSTNCTIDVKVTSFSAKHKTGSSITYYTAPSDTIGL